MMFFVFEYFLDAALYYIMSNLNTYRIPGFAGYQTIIDDEVLMQTALYKVGPLIVSFNADCLIGYQPGQIINGSYPSVLNHNALAVGYGYDSVSNLSYYIVKNSWGSAWGKQQ